MPYVTITPSLKTYDTREEARGAAVAYASILWPNPLRWQNDTLMVKFGKEWLPTHIRVREVDHHLTAPNPNLINYPDSEFR